MKMYAWIVSLGLACVACSAPNQKSTAEDKAMEVALLQQAPAEAPAALTTADAVGQAAPATPARATAAPAASRKLIYHAEVSMKVSDLGRANARIDSLTQAYGAYVSDAAETRQAGEWEHKMTIRVLPAQFSALLAGLNGLGTIESKTLSTDDVTAEHADVSARLRTKRALEQRYVALLSQAKKISDILEIEQQIGEVRGDIEATESRLKTLNDQVGYSTITLTYFQVIPLDTPDAPVLSFASRFTQAFYQGWELLTGMVLVLVTAWPLVVLGGAGFWVLRAWRQRREQRSRTA
jgi:hypothetical protein